MPCMMCDDCSIKNASEKEIVYELHVTVSSGSCTCDKCYDDFIKKCNELNVKGILIDNILSDGSIQKEFITKSSTKENPYYELLRISNSFDLYNIQRCKIETVPWWHLRVPTKINGKKFGKNQYFETHFDLTFNLFTDKFVQEIGLYISKTKEKRFATFRSDELVLEDYNERIDKYCKILGVKEVITEFCIFDTNREKDNLWLEKVT